MAWGRQSKLLHRAQPLVDVFARPILGQAGCWPSIRKRSERTGGSGLAAATFGACVCPLVYLKSDISCFLAGFFSCDGLSVRLIVAGLLFRQGVPPYAKPPLMAMALFATHRIFQSADRVLHLAGGLVGLAFSFQLLVAEDLSGGFLHGSPWPALQNL